METGKTIALTIGVVVVIVAILGYLFLSSSTGPVVSAQGYSTLTVQPDKASIYLNVESRQTTAQEAKDAVFAASDKVLTELVKLGLERKDIQTSEITTYPEWDYNYYGGGNKIKGYVASQQLVVKTNDFDKVADIVDRAVDAGALVTNINFELSQEKQNEYKAKALKLAGEDAKIKAAVIAESQGKSLGSLVDVTSSDFNYQPYPYFAMAKETAMADVAGANAEVRSAVMNIVPKENEVSANVNVRYKLSRF